MVYRPRYLRNTKCKTVNVYSDDLPYLKIEIKKAHSVPILIFKGKRIENIKEIDYSWETDTCEHRGPSKFYIEHYEKVGEEPLIIKEGFENLW